MHPDPIQRLIEYFMRLPGIGPRQASRFAYTLLDEDKKAIRGFRDALADLETIVGRCEECYRGVERKNGSTLCNVCKNDELSSILVLEKDQDLENISKSGVWNGGYHVLGGTISILNEKSRVTDRIKGLYDRVARRSEKHAPLEIVLATSATPEGDSTSLYIERILAPFTEQKKTAITRLGRGISTGAEIEYTDPQTLKNAFNNRK